MAFIPTDLITQEEALLEDFVIEAVLGDGLFTLSTTLAEREITLPCKWPNFEESERLKRLTQRYCHHIPREEMIASDYYLALGRAVCEVLPDRSNLPAWLPVDEKGNPNPADVRGGGILRQLAKAWESKESEVNQWLFQNDGLNLQRLVQLNSLRLRDAVARTLNTHPFDPRLSELSELQMQVLLELRYPSKKEDGDAELQQDAERLEAEDEYRIGIVVEPDETPDDALDLALYAQSG